VPRAPAQTYTAEKFERAAATVGKREPAHVEVRQLNLLNRTRARKEIEILKNKA
jgi:hypothetical protein